jgi:amino acid transporter
VLKRDFALWSTFAVGFALVSPILAVYGSLGFALQAGGPGVWWELPVAMLGALTIALVLAQLASRWPFEGSIYQWSRRLVGPTYGWFAGWTYFCTYVIGSAAVCYGVVGLLPAAFGIDPGGNGTRLLLAFLVLVVVTLVNISGRRWLKLLAAASIGAEVIGSIGLATVLLLFHREQTLSILVDYQGLGVGGGFGFAGLLAAMAFIGFAFNGFESAGAIAEEVKDPVHDVPRAMILVVLFIGLVAMYSSLAIILAMADPPATLAGADPMVAVIIGALGSGASRPLFLVFILSFTTVAVTAQTTVSRVVWAFARDGLLPRSERLSRLSGPDRLPVHAILLTTAVITLLLLVGLLENAFQVLITFTSAGFFLAFAFAVFAFLTCRLQGRWQPGPFSIGRWTTPIAAAAAGWCTFMYLNLAWPRGGRPWHERWGVLVITAVSAAAGLVTYLLRREHITSSALGGAAPQAQAVTPAKRLPA